MRRLGRRTGWLGWAVAGVLLVSAAGTALAAQDTTTTTQSPAASGDKAKARMGRSATDAAGGMDWGAGVLHAR